jgi:antitoxin PrlF
MAKATHLLQATPGSRMTSKGQITVPAVVRKRLNVKPGDRLVFREDDGKFYIESATAWVDRTFGMLAHLAKGKPPATIEEMEEAAAAGWAREPFEPAE